MIHAIGSRARVASTLVVLGLAASANAQNDTSLLQFQVRPQGASASAWTTDLTVAPGTIVEFRALVTYTGTAPAVGLAVAQFQPTVSNWTVQDVLQPFRTFGTGTSSSAPTPQNGSVALDSGLYGRVAPHVDAGLASQNALRGHTNNVSGVRYLRIAQTPATNWAGVGPTSGTAQNNNWGGSGGLALGQRAPITIGGVNPDFVEGTVGLEVARFAVRVDGQAQRVLEVSAPAMSVSPPFYAQGQRVFSWHRSLQSNGSVEELVWGTVTIQSALIRVPTPGALALLGMGGLVAGRRRRGTSGESHSLLQRRKPCP